MGGSLSRTMRETMEENLKQQQEFMLKTQQMQLERQIQMQTAMRERMMAQQIAMGRIRTYYYGTFYALATFGLTAGYLRTSRPSYLAPLVPLSFFMAYQLDISFGSQIKRAIEEAEEILRNEQGLVALPGGAPTMAFLDARRKK